MKIKNIYYRGSLKTCNYKCEYCPFCKNSIYKGQVKDDRNSLKLFTEKIKNIKTLESVMFVPYGEALIHSYYWKYISIISCFENIKSISCQTNLSFNINNSLNIIKQNGGFLEKIKLWCSFHPSMVSVDNFLEKCFELYNNNINFCVGVVGDYDNISYIKEIRRRLPNDVYMWINYKDGLKIKYTKQEIEDFCNIDPLFKLELKKSKSDSSKCLSARESIFVRSNGDFYACNLSNIKLGNLYKQEFDNDSLELNSSNICMSNICSCYLSYCNRDDLKLLNCFGNSRYIRIPSKKLIKAIFFDIDGTLVDEHNNISNEIYDMILNLSERMKIYLITSLPFHIAIEKCSKIKSIISGGIFCNGAYIKDFESDYEQFIQVDSKILSILNPALKIRKYKHYDKICKIAILHNNKIIAKESFKKICKYKKEYNIVLEDTIISITNKDATKLKSILSLCNELKYDKSQIAVVGNSENDMEILKYFDFSFTPLDSDENVKKVSNYILDIKYISMII